MPQSNVAGRGRNHTEQGGGGQVVRRGERGGCEGGSCGPGHIRNKFCCPDCVELHLLLWSDNDGMVCVYFDLRLWKAVFPYSELPQLGLLPTMTS